MAKLAIHTKSGSTITAPVEAPAVAMARTALQRWAKRYAKLIRRAMGKPFMGKPL